MFTGIIEEIGTIGSVRRGVRSAVMAIRASAVLEGTAIGDSIAVNGVCLTVSHLGHGWFSADAMPETLDRSVLGSFAPGQYVNLERAMKADGRFGGHMVQGHVDAIGKVLRIIRDDNASRVEIQTGEDALRYIVEKGSVAVDGVSLTVADVGRSSFTVSVIPHTASSTTISELRPGDGVNIETDIIGRYVRRFLAERTEVRRGLSEDFLFEHGFIGGV